MSFKADNKNKKQGYGENPIEVRETEHYKWNTSIVL